MVCWSRVRERLMGSSTVVVLIVFLDLFTDSLLLTLVDPILPDIIARLDNTTVESNTDASESINFNGRYGYLVAAKGGAQFISNLFVGFIVQRTGYRIPMFIGNILLISSTLAFAFGPNYEFLFFTRVLQGISSSITAVTGMGLLAATFPDNTQRGKVMGIAIGGLSLGIIFGPVYGSLLYQFVGRSTPFIVLAAMVAFCAILQVLTLHNDSKSTDGSHSGMGIFKLLVDPYILIVAGNIFLLNLDVSVILAFLPIRLLDLENPDPWKLGIVVLPTSIGYLLASFIFPRLTFCLKRWLSGLLGMIFSGATLVGLAFSNTFLLMLLVTTFLGVALGMVSTAMQPMFAYLVDIRHETVYGNVYAISDMAVCLSMFIGPLLGGPLYFTVGFFWMVIGVAVLNVAYSQFSLLLRNPPPREFKDIGVEEEQEVDRGLYEKHPLLIHDKLERSWDGVSVASSRMSSRSKVAAEMASIPTPRYVACLSAAEDLCSDADSVPIDCPYRSF